MAGERVSPKTREILTRRFSAIIEEGKMLEYQRVQHFYRPLPQDEYLKFRTQAVNLLRTVCNEKTEHYQELMRIIRKEGNERNSEFLSDYLAVLEAARNDFELLLDLPTLISAELLAGFMDQAEHLLDQGFHVPAASLAGAVLEDTLRKLCQANNIPVPEKATIDPLNAELAKHEVYDKLVQKRITVFADIRNKADHGYFEQFTLQDVKDMVRGVRQFARDYLR